MPPLNTPRMRHSSCVVGDSIFVVAGQTSGYKRLSSIEMLSMRLKGDLSFAFLRKSWSQTNLNLLTPRRNPFVSAIGHNSLLIYGGYESEIVPGGVIVDLDKNKK